MGQSLSNPITAQHIERHNTDLFRAAVDHVCGFRDNQEDAHTVEYNVNGQGLSIVAVYDGHGGPRCSQWLQQNIPRFFAPLVTTTTQGQVGSISLKGNFTIAAGQYFMDDRAVYEDVLTTLMYEIDDEFLKFSAQEQFEDGSTAVITLLQPWDLVNNKSILSFSTPLSYNDRDTIGVKVISINIGDSRSLIIRNQTFTRPLEPPFTYCTVDHKPSDPEERARIYASGGIVQNNRVDASLALSRAFGDIQYKGHRNYSHYSQVPPQDRRVCVTPTFTEYIARYGDILFVACDGLFESDYLGQVEPLPSLIKFNKEQLIGPYRSSTEFAQLCFDPAVICRNLIQESIAFGSKDNHTAIIVSFAGIPNDLPALLEANHFEEGPREEDDDNEDAQEVEFPDEDVLAKEAEERLAQNAVDRVKVANTSALKRIIQLEQLDSFILVPGPTWQVRGENLDSTFITKYKDDVGPEEYDRLINETLFFNELLSERQRYLQQSGDVYRGIRDLLSHQNFNNPAYDAQAIARMVQLVPIGVGIPDPMVECCNGIVPIAFEKKANENQNQVLPPQLLQMMLNAPYGMGGMGGMGMDDQ